MLDWSFSFGGLTVGDSPAIMYSNLDLVSLPDVRSNDLALIQRDGLWPGDDYYGGRTVNISLRIQGRDAEEFSHAVNSVQAAFRLGANGETPFAFRIPGLCNGRTAYFNARTRRRSSPLDMAFARLYCAFEIELFATDPFIYASEETSVTVRKGTTARVMVAGSREVKPTVTYTGLTSPKLTDSITGQVLPAAPVLSPGDHFLSLTDSGSNADGAAQLKWRDTWV
ncbi:hypothetical protein [Streptomyces chrestomyceticus]|uniref:hypothetical protein n=1 Tax=Streptomyces chrestomyceticus TaxID=68185 RepID=UPI0037A6CEE2